MPALYGRVASVSGQATIRREGREGWRPALVADDLHAGDVVKTAPDGSLVAQFGDGSSLELAAETEVALGQPSGAARRPAKAKLSQGDIVASIEPGGGPFEVNTPLAVAGVQGTKFALEATGRKAVLTVLEGKVEFWNDLGSVLAAAMERSVVVPGHAPTDPHRLAGRQPDGIYAGKWHLHHGGYLYVDTISHTTPEARAILEELRASPETPELLEAALGPLWSRGGGITLSLECAREVAGRPGRLTDLRRADLGTAHPLTVEEGTVGLPIFEVLDGSAAEAAGLQRGDVMVAVDGHQVATETDLICQLWRTEPGSEVDVAFVRDGERQTVTVTTSPAVPGPQELALFAALRLRRADPDHASAQIVVANALACTGRLARARSAYNALAGNQRDDPVLLDNLGVLAAVEGRLGDALEQYGKAAELAPEFEGAWLNIAKVYGRSGMDAVELGLLERLVDEHPEWETASAKLARTLVRHDRGAGKLTTIKTLANRHPESAELAAYHVRALQAAAQPEQAAAACARALAMASSSEAREALAEYLLERADGPAGVDALVSQWAAYRNPWTYVHLGSAAALEQGVQLDPLNSTGYTGYLWEFLGDGHMGERRYAEAVECFLKAAELEPEWAAPWERAGDASRAAYSPEAMAYYEKAAEVGTRYGEAHPQNLEVALRSAVAVATHAAVRGDEDRREQFIRLGEAAAEKAEALAHERAPELHLILVDDYYVPRQDWEAATRSCRRALALDAPRAAQAISLTAGRLMLQEQWVPATALVATVLTMEPEAVGTANVGNVLGVLANASVYASRHEHIAQVQMLTPLVGRLRDDSYVRGALALLRCRRGDGEGALRELEAAPDGGASEWYLLFVRARALGAAGRRSEALAAALNAIKVWPPDVDPTMAMGLLRLDPEAGARALAERIAAEEVSVLWLYRLADLLADAGDVEAEEQALLTIQAEYPGSGWTSLGDFYMRQGRLDEAEEAFQRGLEALPPGSPDHAVVQCCLAKLFAQQRRWEEAIDHACLSLRHIAGATYPQWTIGPSLDVLTGALDEGITPQQATQIGEALLTCVRAIDEGLVAPRRHRGVRASEAVSYGPLWEMVERVAALADEEGQFQFWQQLLNLKGRTAAARRTTLRAARALAELDPGRVRSLLEDRTAQERGNPLAQLALWSVARDDDPQTATKAALAAVSCAGLDSDRGIYTEVAEFLAEADLEAGLEAFAGRLKAAGGLAGPLGLGYAKLAAGAGDWEWVVGVVDGILECDDDDSADAAACWLAGQGRYAEAMDLMEHALRLDVMGEYRDSRALWEVFAPAGEAQRLAALYEELAEERPGDYMLALFAEGANKFAGNRERQLYWLERAEGIKPDWPTAALMWAEWYQGVGDLARARGHYERAEAVDWAADRARQGVARIDALGDALGPVDTLCAWVREELSDELAGEAAKAALAGGDEGRPWMAVVAALRTLADRDPERMVRGGRRAAEDYPDNLAAMVALAVIGTDLGTDDLDSPAAAARAALAAANGSDPDLTPCVYTVCGEILLREGWREEAVDAFRRAMEDPCMAPEWKARAEAGLQAASEPTETEEPGQPDEAPAEEPGGEAEGEG